MNKNLIILICIALFGCEQKIVHKKNKKLIGFKSEWIGEYGDEKFNIAEPLAESKKIESKQVDEILIIKTWILTNACGKYQEDISIKGDTIILRLDLISEEVCTSEAIKKLTYVIDNPKRKYFNR